MKKIAILGLHLGYGGTEQAIVNLANMLCDNYQVELVVAYQTVQKIPYKINPKVTITYLTNTKPNRKEFEQCLKAGHLWNAFKEGIKSVRILNLRTKLMKQYIKNSNANIIISSRILYTNLLSKYAKKNVITMAQEHRHHNHNQKYIKQLKKACRGIDYLLPVSRELTEDYQKYIQNNRTHCLFMPNSLENASIKYSKLEEKNLISIGRISHEKGYLDLIDVFELVYQKYPTWKLNIIGDGDEMNLLKEKINEKKLFDSVILHGFQDKNYIYQMLAHSSIYVMCSYEESFGIVLLEAASCGIPLLAFSSARGPHEIIENGLNGYLIENRDIKKMANKIEKLIKDKEKRKKLGENAKKSVEQYSFEAVKNKWLTFLSKMEE